MRKLKKFFKKSFWVIDRKIVVYNRISSWPYTNFLRGPKVGRSEKTPKMKKNEFFELKQEKWYLKTFNTC